MNGTRLNICQPGHNASCALCCGSHNYKADYRTICELFANRADGIHRSGEGHHASPPVVQKLLKDAVQCPHVGFIDREQSRIGCLIYHSKGASQESGFFSHTCKYFFCHAREILNDSEILFAARLFGDWYYYSLLVNSITLLKRLMARYHLPEEIQPGDRERIMAELRRAVTQMHAGHYPGGMRCHE